jgi:5'-3' exonuclease
VIIALKQAISDLPGGIAEKQSSPKISVVLPILSAIIAAVAAIIAAISTFFAGSMTANTNAALTRVTTLYSEIAKKDSDIYDVAHDQIAALEQAFETFLLEKKINPQTDPYRIANNLDKMCIANRFGPYTDIVRDFNDFIAKTISVLQHNLEQWKDADALTKEARQKCQKAIDALDALAGKK